MEGGGETSLAWELTADRYMHINSFTPVLSGKEYMRPLTYFRLIYPFTPVLSGKEYMRPLTYFRLIYPSTQSSLALELTADRYMHINSFTPVLSGKE